MSDPSVVSLLAVRRLPIAKPTTQATTHEAVVEIEPQPTLVEIKHQLASAFAAELEALRDEAREQGYREGYAAGSSQALDEGRRSDERRQSEHDDVLASLRSEVERLQRLLKQLDDDVRAALQDMEPLALEIAFASLTRVIGSADHYRDVLAAVVTQAIDTMDRQSEALRVSMRSEDLDAIKGLCQPPGWLACARADRSLEPGSCVVEIGPRGLDASLLQQLEALRACLIQVCDGRHA